MILKLKITKDRKIEWLARPSLCRNSVQVDSFEITNCLLPNDTVYAVHMMYKDSFGQPIATDYNIEGIVDDVIDFEEYVKNTYVDFMAEFDGEVWRAKVPNCVLRAVGTISVTMYLAIKTYINGVLKIKSQSLPQTNFHIEDVDGMDYALLDPTVAESTKEEVDKFKSDVLAELSVMHQDIDDMRVVSNTAYDTAISAQESATSSAEDARLSALSAQESEDSALQSKIEAQKAQAVAEQAEEDAGQCLKFLGGALEKLDSCLQNILAKEEEYVEICEPN